MNDKRFTSPAAMMNWQYQEIIWELGEVARHIADPNCPCNLADKGEFCGPKHALCLHGLCRESAMMEENKANKELLEELQAEAWDKHVALKDRIVCGNIHKDEGDVVDWARNWRKRIEKIYYHQSCKVSLRQDGPAEIQCGLAQVKVPSTCTVLKTHDDGDQTLKCKTGNFVVTTEGQTFKETQAKLLTPESEKTVSVTGRCGTTVESCVFNIRRKGTPHKVVKEVTETSSTVCKAANVQELVSQSKNLLEKRVCTLHQEPTVKISGTCGATGCSLKVKGAVETSALTDAPGLAEAINTAIHHFDTRPVTTPTARTFAPGISTANRYEFEFKVVEASDLIVSHDVFTFQPNPAYTAKLQPRIRERLANQMQVRKIAAQLDPEKLLLDTKAIDTGSPIVGPDNLVECGNGRVMALVLAAKEHPANIELYRHALKGVAHGLGMPVAPIDKMVLPVLVRVRLTPVDRQAFAEECNARPTIETSAIEKARTDADKITPAMLQSLDILEGESIDHALRSERNKAFVSAYLSKVPSNEQAALIDSRGYLSSDGIRRMVMGIFAATFKGDTGLSLASKFFEAIDETGVKNAFNGILRSLGIMAQAENLVASGQREPGLTIGEDLAKAMTVFSNLRGADMSVEKYLAQAQMLERQLTPFQETVLVGLDTHARSAKRIGNILTYYAQAVIESASPGQVQMIPGPKPDKAVLFAQAVKRAVSEAEAEKLEKAAKMKNEQLADSEVLTVYHATIRKHLKSIQSQGLQPPESASAGWYMVTDSLNGAKKYATGDDPIILRFDIPSNEVNKYLWTRRPACSDYYGCQYAIRSPIPAQYMRIEEPEAAMKCSLPVCLLQGYEIIRKNLKRCNLTEEDFTQAMNYRPLRNLLATALSWKGVEVELCSAMVRGAYQVTLDGLSINNDEKILSIAMKTKGMKQVYTKTAGQRVYEIVVPEIERGKTLMWTPQEISHTPAQSQGTQAAMFSPSAKLADPLLVTIARELCAVGVCLASESKSKTLPTCTPARADKLERCILKVKARNISHGCTEEGNGTKKCPNSFGVCQSSLKCKLPGRKE